MTCSRSLPPPSHVEVEEIKKGLKSPCFRAPPRLAGGSSTLGDAPSYENSNPKMPHDLRLSCGSLLPRLPALCRSYKHCGNAGQGKYGRTLARGGERGFKHAFEIEAARNSADVNPRRLPQRDRDFARERPANRRRRLIS
jgi:hypothetical protein